MGVNREAFHLRCLRFICGIKWSNRIPNAEVLGRSGISYIDSILITTQFRWVGHILRMEGSRINISSSVSSILVQEHWTPSSLKKNIKSCKLDFGTWHALAEDRTAWRTTCHKAVHTSEEIRIGELQERRTRRKASTSLPPSSLEHMCTVCGRACKSKIGLASHKRRHRP